MLSIGRSRSPEPLGGSRSIFGSPEAVFGAFLRDYIKRMVAQQSSLDYQSQPKQENPLKSLNIEETMVALSLAPGGTKTIQLAATKAPQTATEDIFCELHIPFGAITESPSAVSLKWLQ